MNNQPIGIFDSGIGGLTVMREIIRQLPHEHIVYFADTAHLPYGEKSPEAICRYASESASFLMDKQIKLLILACHTASCHALTALTAMLPIPVLGILDTSLKILQTLPPPIALLATTSTIQSRIYQTHIPHLIPIACPSFVPLIEQGLSPSFACLSPILEQRIPTLFLACTHYPLIATQLQHYLGPHIHIADPSLAFAGRIHHILSALNLLNPQHNAPQYEFHTSSLPTPSRDFFLQRLEQKLEIVK